MTDIEVLISIYHASTNVIANKQMWQRWMLEIIEIIP